MGIVIELKASVQMKKSVSSAAGMFVVGCVQSVHAQVVHEDMEIVSSIVENENRFGISIAIENGILAVGSELDDDQGYATGSVYLFDESTGEQIARVVLEDGESRDYFGGFIAMENGLLAIGATGDASEPTLGSVYVFDASTGDQLSKLQFNDGEDVYRFNGAIAMDDGMIAIGIQTGRNTGGAYLFDVQTGDQIYNLTIPAQSRFGDFGGSIDIDDGIVAVGDQSFSYVHPDSDLISTGAVYLFDATTGEQLSMLVTDEPNRSALGRSVDIHNGLVAVGASSEMSGKGAVYLFNITTGQEIKKFVASDGWFDDYFGGAVSMQGNVLAVGATGEETNGSNSGAAYLFDIRTGIEIAKLLPSNGSRDAFFGGSVIVENNTAIVAAASPRLGTRGSVYFFDVPSYCASDITNDGELDFFDISEFLRGYLAENPVVDFYTDGIFDFFDVSEFLEAFTEDCP